MRKTSIFASLLLATTAGTALAQTVVTASGQAGWNTVLFDDGINPVSGSATFVNGVGSPPLGTGSLELTTGQYGDGASRIYTNNFVGTPLASITSMGYSSYTQAASYSGLHIYLSLRVDYNNDGSEDDVIFFEPEYQNGYTGNVPTQADAGIGSWQNWDALAGGWWSNNNALGTGAAGASVLPLSAFVAAYPNAVLTSDVGPSLRLTAGFGAPTWDNFVGNVDNFHLTIVGGQASVYDFEAVPTPGAAALLGIGGLAAFRRRR